MALEDRIEAVEKRQRRLSLAVLIIAGVLAVAQVIETSLRVVSFVETRRVMREFEQASDDQYREIVEEVEKAFGMRGGQEEHTAPRPNEY